MHGEACDLSSDHWPIYGFLRLERKELWCTTNEDEFSQRGWVPKTDEAKRTFMRGVAKDLCWMDEEASHAVGLTPTTVPYDSGVVFKNTGNDLQISGPH